MHGRRELRAFGQAIRRMREARGLSQEALADRAGLHRTYIGGIERGERNVSFLNIIKLSKALGIRLDELMRGVEDG